MHIFVSAARVRLLLTAGMACRCHDSMQRVSIAMRVPEGQSGTVFAYIVPKNAPKTCNRIVCAIQALSLHERIRVADSSRPFAHIDVSGDFLASDGQQWLASCLADLPKQQAGQEAALVYQSTVLQTQVVVTCRDGAMRLSSDNPCALAMLRDTIMRCTSSVHTSSHASGHRTACFLLLYLGYYCRYSLLESRPVNCKPILMWLLRVQAGQREWHQDQGAQHFAKGDD
jgi:hypothetical protein